MADTLITLIGRSLRLRLLAKLMRMGSAIPRMKGFRAMSIRTVTATE
jgi:hypothetical protein